MDFLSKLTPERQKDFWELMSQKSIHELEDAIVRAKARSALAKLEPSDVNCKREHEATKELVGRLLWASEIIRDVREAAEMPEEEPYYLIDEGVN